MAHIDIDLQPVRLYGLDSQRLVECCAAYFYICVPQSGRAVLTGRNLECVETVFRLAAHFSGEELSLRSVDVDCGRVGVRNLVLAVQDHCQVQGVSGTPYSALPVDEALHSFLQCLASGVETAQRLLAAVRHFQVSD